MKLSGPTLAAFVGAGAILSSLPGCEPHKPAEDARHAEMVRLDNKDSKKKPNKTRELIDIFVEKCAAVLNDPNAQKTMETPPLTGSFYHPKARDYVKPIPTVKAGKKRILENGDMEGCYRFDSQWAYVPDEEVKDHLYTRIDEKGRVVEERRMTMAGISHPIHPGTMPDYSVPGQGALHNNDNKKVMSLNTHKDEKYEYRSIDISPTTETCALQSRKPGANNTTEKPMKYSTCLKNREYGLSKLNELRFVYYGSK